MKLRRGLTRPRMMAGAFFALAGVFALVLTAGVSAAAPVKAKPASPHASAKGSTDLCATCHFPSGGTTAKGKGGAFPSSVGMCGRCHDSRSFGAPDENGLYSGPSGHLLPSSTPATETPGACVACTDCHSAHADPAKRQGLWRSKSAGHKVKGYNSWCFSCHDDANHWYTGGGLTYPSLSAPLKDEQGYPVLGTFPGPTVYEDEKANPHAKIPASGGETTRVAGDCLYCHAAHTGVSRYDGLVARYQPSTAQTVMDDRASGGYAALCFTCHDGTRTGEGAANIEQFATYDGWREGVNSGHRVVSPGGLLPEGAPLPCYDCHNPHGSSRGNASLLADTRGAGLDTSAKAGAPGVRAFCLTCHSSSDGSVWSSEADSYGAVTPTDTVEGLRRDGGAAGSGPAGEGHNLLLLKDVKGHAVDDPQSCYECHGDDYSTASSHNVHAPGSGARSTPQVNGSPQTSGTVQSVPATPAP